MAADRRVRHQPAGGYAAVQHVGLGRPLAQQLDSLRLLGQATLQLGQLGLQAGLMLGQPVL
jgi:hypothetical protein